MQISQWWVQAEYKRTEILEPSVNLQQHGKHHYANKISVVLVPVCDVLAANSCFVDKTTRPRGIHARTAVCSTNALHCESVKMSVSNLTQLYTLPFEARITPTIRPSPTGNKTNAIKEKRS